MRKTGQKQNQSQDMFYRRGRRVTQRKANMREPMLRKIRLDFSRITPES